MIPEWFVYLMFAYLVINYSFFLILGALVWFFVKKVVVRNILASICVLLFVISSGPRLFPIYTVQGRVLDADTGAPIRHAVVSCHPYSPMRRFQDTVLPVGDDGTFSYRTRWGMLDVSMYHPQYGMVVKSLASHNAAEWKYFRFAVPVEIRAQSLLSRMEKPDLQFSWRDLVSGVFSFQKYVSLADSLGTADNARYQSLPEEWRRIAGQLETLPFKRGDEYAKKDALEKITLFESLISSGTMVEYARDPGAFLLKRGK